MNSRILIIFCGAVLLSLLAVAGCTTDAPAAGSSESEITVTDGFGRSVPVPYPVESILCSDDEGAIGQLKHDPALKGLTAVKEGRVYGVLPYTFYNVNHGTVLANAYFVGKVLYPDRFGDVDPAEKADEIYSFLLGEPVFDLLNS